MDTLFKNATILTMEAENKVLFNTDLKVSGEKIVEIAKSINSENCRVINCENKVIMPGLYNCHAHAAMVMMRGFGNDKTLEDWLFNYIFPAERNWTPELIKTATTLACADMISLGIISFSDMYFFMDTVADVAFHAGMLANVSNAVIGFDKDTYDFHKDNVYEQSLRAIEKYKNNKQIKIDASIHGVYTSHPPAWKQVMDFTHKYNLGMHVHLSETKTEHEGAVKNYGKTPAAVFNEHGVFDVPAIAAHSVWVTDEDMDILKEKNVTVAHNPISNLKLASGLAPINKIIEKGINVAIGTDGVSSNNSHDIFEELKMASLLQKYAANDPTALPAYEAIKMATTNGAKAQGREKESGIIKEGYNADLILLDFNNPRQLSMFDPILNIAYGSCSKDVEMTMCQGRVLFEKGEYKTIDIEKVMFEARKAHSIFS